MGHVPGANAVATYVDEVIVHTWDLARAWGRTEWDPEVLAVADAVIRAQLPVADRERLWAAVKQHPPPGTRGRTRSAPPTRWPTMPPPSIASWPGPV